MTWSITIIGLVSLGLGFYPSVSTWFNAYNQSRIVESYANELESVSPDAQEQLRLARKYNNALSAGVELKAHASVASGTGTTSDDSLNYESILKVNELGLMARLKVPSVDIDIPVYHGTSGSTLMIGSGHLEGSHLPIGGDSTRSVLTAHRGLATSTMFTNLDKVALEDTFSIEVFGEILVYKVRDITVIQPEETDTLKVEPGKDLVTLITCTPLGINSHRILVTGERIAHPQETLVNDVTAEPTIPGFPWWIVWITAGITALSTYIILQGRLDGRGSMSNIPQQPTKES